jgi:RimJ/RimL family protein N-acetyltransferase
MDPIVTERLLLRPVQRSDLRTLHRFYGDAEAMRFITGRARTPWETRARLVKDLDHHARHGFGLCIVVERASGESIGRCGLEPQPRPDGVHGELAWLIGPSRRGRGFATEAGRALIRYGQQELHLPRIFAVSHPSNAASIRIMGKLGMSLVAERTEEVEYEA